MKPIARILPLTLALLATASTCSVLDVRAQNDTMPTQSTAGIAIDSVARQQLTQTFNAYRALQSYSSEMRWEDTTKAEQNGQAALAFQKPAWVSVHSKTIKGSRTHIINGQKFAEMRVRNNRARYVSKTLPLSSAVLQEVFAPLDISRIGLASALLFRNPLETFENEIYRLSSREATPTDTRGLDEDGELNVVELALKPRSTPGGKEVTLTFISAKDDDLLRRVRIQIGDGEHAQTLTETYLRVVANPTLETTDFAFVPPTGAKRIRKFAAKGERFEEGGDPIPIETTALDKQPISLDDYKGRVVLIDFWATWCPACRQQMPGLVAAYNKYHQFGFDIIGISGDSYKKALQSYIAQNKMPWRQIFDREEGRALTKSYGIEAIPFTLLIGRDGTIAAINPQGGQLEPAIRAALAER